jgi:proline iminopeptidase
VEPRAVSRRPVLIAAFRARLEGDDPEARLAAAQAWAQWEGRTVTLRPDPELVDEFGEAKMALAFARIEPGIVSRLVAATDGFAPAVPSA